MENDIKRWKAVPSNKLWHARIVTIDFIDDKNYENYNSEHIIAEDVSSMSMAKHIVEVHNKSLDFPLVKESKYDNHHHNTADEVYMSLNKNDVHMIRGALTMWINSYEEQCKRNAEQKEEMLTWTDEYHYEKMTGGDAARLNQSKSALEKLETVSTIRNEYNNMAISMKYGRYGKDGKGGHVNMSPEEVTEQYKKEGKI